MRQQTEPIIIHKLGASGRVKDTYFGVMRNNKPELITNVDTLEDLLIKIKSKQ